MDWTEDHDVQKYLIAFSEGHYEARVAQDPNDGWNWWVADSRNPHRQAEGSEETEEEAKGAVEATVDRWNAFEAGKSSMRGARGILTDVEWFHEIMGVPVRSAPGFPSDERVALRIDLIQEEWEKETLPAIERRDFVEVADGLIDLVYVVTGTLLEFGIPPEVWDEVQRSNMAKRDPSTGRVRYRDDGKVLKPEGWTRPDVEGVLRAYGWKK